MLRTLLGWLLNSPDLAGGDLVGWRLVWGGSWTALGFGAALVIGVAASVLIYHRQDRIVGRRWQAVLAVLRIAAFAALLLLLTQPVLRITKTGVVKGTCVILVDRTRSMSIVDRLGHRETTSALRALGVLEPAVGAGDGTDTGDALGSTLVPVSDEQRRLLADMSRFVLIKRALDAQAAEFLAPLTDRFKVELMTFGPRVEALAPPSEGENAAEGSESLRRLIADLDDPAGDATRIGTALRAVLERSRGGSLAGVILISDGVSNAGEDPRVVAVSANRAGVPIYPVGVGALQARDLQLAHILGEDVVFKDDLKPLTVRIRSTGYTGRKVNLILAVGEGANERVIKVKRDVVITGDGDQTEEIQFVPDREGRMRLSVRIEPLPDEQNRANNARSKTLRVIDAKIRVLYVESQPRWEYRYLRHAMQRDRRVQPTFLLQEADPETVGFGGDEDAGDSPPEFIRTFPDRREDLFDYDVILFGDVNLGYLTRSQLRTVAEFVSSGGGFGLIAGSIQEPVRLAATPIGPVLPVRFENAARPVGARGRRPLEREIYQPLTKGYRPRLTPVGRSHPVTRLAATVEASVDLWSELPEFYWYSDAVSRIQPAGEVLMEHPTVRNRFGTLPLVVVRPYGQGKAMFVGFDEVWRWRIARPPSGDASGGSGSPGSAGEPREGDRSPFYRFYGQMIQFLGLSHVLGENRRVQVTMGRRETGVGEPVSIFARVLDESFKPAVAESVTAVIRRAPGASAASPEDREVARVKLMAEEGAPGTYRGEFVPAEVGEYEVAIEAQGAGNGAGQAAFAVTEPRLEFERVSRDEPLLMALADLSGGTAVELDGLSRLPDEIHRKQRAERVHFEVPLWDSWLALLLVVSLLCVEWLIRKRVRLA